MRHRLIQRADGNRRGLADDLEVGLGHGVGDHRIHGDRYGHLFAPDCGVEVFPRCPHIDA